MVGDLGAGKGSPQRPGDSSAPEYRSAGLLTYIQSLSVVVESIGKSRVSPIIINTSVSAGERKQLVKL